MERLGAPEPVKALDGETVRVRLDGQPHTLSAEIMASALNTRTNRRRYLVRLRDGNAAGASNRWVSGEDIDV